MAESTQSKDQDQLRAHYTQLWETGIERIRTGNVEVDPVLAGSGADLRRGLSLMFRPSSVVQRRVLAFLNQLRQFEPSQYYYAPSEMHVTFLSLFTATVNHAKYFAQASQYREAVDCVVPKVAPFEIEFCGISASPGAVMLQGFFKNGVLNDGRDCLRAELRSRGLGEALDTRYRLTSAHMTVLRFRQPLRDGKAFAERLEAYRDFDFGKTRAGMLHLVKNDWYMSDGSIEELKRYRLGNR